MAPDGTCADVQLAIADAHRIRDCERALVEAFDRAGRAAGLHEIPPAAAVDRNRRTLLFTNSAVIALMPFVTGDRPVPGAGVSVVQPCFRAQVLDDIESADVSTEWLLRFDMLGMFSPSVEHMSLVVRSALEESGFDIDRVRCTMRGDHADLIDGWRAAFGPDSYTVDDLPSDWYEWTFGREHLVGRGSTISYLMSSGAERELGNVIVFEHEGRVTGAGLGIGVPTAVSALNDEEHVVAGTAWGALLDDHREASWWLRDLLGSVAYFAANDVRPGARGHRRIVRRTQHVTQRLARDLGYTPADCRRICRGVLTLMDDTRPEAMELVERLLPDDAPRQSVHLSFSCPLDLSPDEFVAAVDRDLGGSSDVECRVELVDDYVGSALPGRRGITIAVESDAELDHLGLLAGLLARYEVQPRVPRDDSTPVHNG